MPLYVDISIHAPREGSDSYDHPRVFQPDISIHAPREGSDQDAVSHLIHLVGISIHAPREGSDTRSPSLMVVPLEFLSTLPARGATCRRWKA